MTARCSNTAQARSYEANPLLTRVKPQGVGVLPQRFWPRRWRQQRLIVRILRQQKAIQRQQLQARVVAVAQVDLLAGSIVALRRDDVLLACFAERASARDAACTTCEPPRRMPSRWDGRCSGVWRSHRKQVDTAETGTVTKSTLTKSTPTRSSPTTSARCPSGSSQTDQHPARCAAHDSARSSRSTF